MEQIVLEPIMFTSVAQLAVAVITCAFVTALAYLADYINTRNKKVET